MTNGNYIEPLDTLKRPLHDLRISVTDRCNLRCTYCMPAEVFGERYDFLPPEQLISFDEIVRVTKIMTSLGVKKVRITGGEPLVRPNLAELIERLSKISELEDLTMTTNGLLLKANAKSLKDAGLNRITVSLDTIDSTVLGKMNGKGIGAGQILKGIESAHEVGLSPIKVNAVIERGVNEHTVIPLAQYFKNSGVILRFIEFMDVGNLNDWDQSKVVPSSELVKMIGNVMPIEPIDPAYRGEVAERWKYLDGEGELGFISSVSQPFCSDCTRIRLSADGQIYTCLFGSEGVDLKGPIRKGATNDQLRAILHDIWTLRADRYSDLRAQLVARGGRRKIEMYQIGG